MNHRFARLIGRKIRTFYTLNFIGLLVGFMGYFLALTPSLLPRPVLFLGIVAGFGLVIGYGIGCVLSSLLRWMGVNEPSLQAKRHIWRAAGVLALVLIIHFGFQAADWQNDVRHLIGEPGIDGADVTTVAFISFAIASIVLGISRSIRRGTRRINVLLHKISVIPKRVASILGGFIMAALLIMAFNGVIFRGFVALANSVYSSTNQGTAAGAVKPDSPLRSGGQGSLVAWNSLGRQGRSFIGKGPTAEDIAAFTGRTALQPIRVYAGVESAPTIKERADIVTKELERTGAFERKVLVVMTATGSGWIEPQSSDTVEYMHDGDTALASIQYSYLPSWISLLTDREDATSAGKALFNAVYDKWSQLPENNRPQLIAYGLSLGSFGGQSAFGGASDMAARLDGALFLGTPNFSEPSGEFARNRDPGSPEYRPVYEEGRVVQFAGTNKQIEESGSNWTDTRVLYVQYPSDPVVWWSPNLILNKPDWLRERRAPDVSSSMHWYPFITFIQVTIDQLFAGDVPSGTGHMYGATAASAWAAVTNPAGWNSERTVQLQKHIDMKHE